MSEVEVCYYCSDPFGLEFELQRTREHMPPKGYFYTKSEVQNHHLITVPAHRKCNTVFSDEDNLLRTLLVIGSQNKSVSAKALMEKVTRAKKRDKKLKNKLHRYTIFRDPFLIEDRLLYKEKNLLGVKLPVEPTNRLFERLLKAMHFEICQEPLSTNLKVEGSPLIPYEGNFEDMISDWAGIPSKHQSLRSIGDEYVFDYYYREEGDEKIGLLIARFYDAFAIQASTVRLN